MAVKARIDTKRGIVEHQHDSLGWHWVSAGHRDNGEMHSSAEANRFEWEDGTLEKLGEVYLRSLAGQISHSRIEGDRDVIRLEAH